MRFSTIVAAAAATLFAGFAVVSAFPLSSLAAREDWSDLSIRETQDLLERESLDLSERDVSDFTSGMSSLLKRTEKCDVCFEQVGAKANLCKQSKSHELCLDCMGKLKSMGAKCPQCRSPLDDPAFAEIRFCPSRSPTPPPASPKGSRPSTPTKGKGKRDMTSSSSSLLKRTEKCDVCFEQVGAKANLCKQSKSHELCLDCMGKLKAMGAKCPQCRSPLDDPAFAEIRFCPSRSPTPPPASPKGSRPSTPTKGKGKRDMTSSSSSLLKRTEKCDVCFEQVGAKANLCKQSKSHELCLDCMGKLKSMGAKCPQCRSPLDDPAFAEIRFCPSRSPTPPPASPKGSRPSTPTKGKGKRSDMFFSEDN